MLVSFAFAVVGPTLGPTLGGGTLGSLLVTTTDTGASVTDTGASAVDTGSNDTGGPVDTGVPPVTETTESETGSPDVVAPPSGTGAAVSASSLAGETGGVHCASVGAVPAGWMMGLFLVASVRRARVTS